MGYTASSFSAGQMPTTAQWNVLWANDASFNDGTGIGANVIAGSNIKIDGTGVTNANLNTTAGDIGGAFLTWSPNLVGFSANPTGQYYYSKVGKIVTLYIVQTTNGTSNSATFTISLPFTAATHASFSWENLSQVVDNGSSLTGSATVLSGGTVLNFFKDTGGNGFTTSGNKRTLGMQITYESA